MTCRARAVLTTRDAIVVLVRDGHEVATEREALEHHCGLVCEVIVRREVVACGERCGVWGSGWVAPKRL